MPKADALYEVSWEICNKVGGIYTVVKSKVRPLQTYYKKYYLIGPYFVDKAQGEFQEKLPPDQLKKIFGELKQERDKLAASLAEIESQVEQQRTEIDGAHLKKYDDLRKRRRGIAIALLNGDECGVCAAQLISIVEQQARRGEVVTCPTCGRILYSR